MKKSARGLTLIELMVAVSIIAILSLIGLVAYTDTQKNARNAKRRADITAIANAMEANYGKAVAAQYNGIADTMFSSGVIPTDPANTNTTPESACPGVCKYCVRQGAAAQVGAVCTTTTAAVSTTNGPTGGASNPYWIVCANLEGGGFYCRGNTQ